MKKLLMISVLLIAMLVVGCQEQNTAKVWGQGDPDQNHIKYFGNDNLSRLCYVQTNTINRQGQLIAELALRIRKLEDPNNG